MYRKYTLLISNLKYLFGHSPMPASQMEETLREAACMGNICTLKKILQTGAKVNAQNPVNGW